MMNALRRISPLVLSAAAAVALGFATPAVAEIEVQCPDWEKETGLDPATMTPGQGDGYKCMHVSGSDGFSMMADGRRLYGFSFYDLSKSTYLAETTASRKGFINPDEAALVAEGALAANFPAPTITLDEGDQFRLTLTNVGMLIRPDLFDPHTVHYHGFPEASALFDGVPDVSVSINQGASITYYYNVEEPGTYMWHCHVEATEHMQMGMLGSLFVRPAQNRLPVDGTEPAWHAAGNKYVYNDGDGSTLYDVEYPIQLASLDSVFHDASETVQPLPFADMFDDYALINGRGYPDTTLEPGVPINNGNDSFVNPPYNTETQNVSSLITATAGQKVLLRVINLSITNFYTLGVLGLKMKVVGRGARLLRGHGVTDTAENDLYYETSSVNIGGGEAIDVIIDTAGVAPGTYVLQTTNLNFLSNGEQDLGGMMTEIVIN